jgi:hypothetical protein
VERVSAVWLAFPSVLIFYLSQSVKESFLEPLFNLSLPLSTPSQLPASLGSVDWLTMQIYILFEYVVTFSIKIYEDFANLCLFLTHVNGK